MNTIPREERLNEYHTRSGVLLAIDVKRSATIEQMIHTLLTRSDPFIKIGEAAVAGAKSYFDDKPHEFGMTRYKVFLEYQRIQRELERRV